jgi:5'-phosphate synthase pdxT subunit
VLSLQGDFACHRAMLEALGVTAVRVTLPADLEDLDALILPGGETTTMLRLLEATRLREPLAAFVKSRPVLGTCAGVILLAAESPNLPAPTFGVLDVTVERNAYGRQIDSFSAEVDPTVFEGPALGVFIRAPRIRRVGDDVEVVARLKAGTRGDARSPGRSAGEPVGVRVGKVAGLCFHPELTADLRFHRWFLTQVVGCDLATAPLQAARPILSRGGTA